MDALDKEIKRLQALQKSRKAGIARIEDRIKWEMKNSGINNLDCPLFKISYSERKENAVAVDEAVFFANNLEEELVNIKMTPNKTAIKEALKSGKTVLGVTLVDSQVLKIS